VADGQSETPSAPNRISPWWLLVGAIALGAVLTALADLVSGGDHLSAIEWLGTTVGVAALVIAVGIYRLQERSGNEAHAELMDQLEAQNELLNDFAKRDEADETNLPTLSESKSNRLETALSEALTDDQRARIEDEFGADSIESAFDPGRGRGKRGRARLVRLRDGRLVSVYEDPRRGRVSVREIDPSRRGVRPRGGGR
jgi:hypothetical protein